MKPAIDKSAQITFWGTKTVLVTGATGFLGGWLVNRLLALGSEAITIVRRARPRSQYSLNDYGGAVVEVTGSVCHRYLIREI